MRNHLGKLVLFLLLATLGGFGCAQASAGPNTANKDSAKPPVKKPTPPKGNASRDDGGEPVSGKRETRADERDPGARPQTAEPTKSDDKTVGSSLPTEQPPWWLVDPIILGLIGVLIFLGLALHILHILTESRFKKELAGLRGAVQLLSRRSSMGDDTEKHGGTGAPYELTQRLNRHRQGLDQLGGKIHELERIVTANERHATEASTAVALAVHIAGQQRINQALHHAAAQNSAADRARAINIVERYREIFGANEIRLKPLMQETCDFALWLNGRSNLPPELTARMEELRSDVIKFEHWHSNLSERLTSLKRGSVTDRYSRFTASLADLAQQFDARAISIADYVKGYGELIERHFPADADGSVSIAPGEYDAELREIAASVPDYLMDWFDRLSQLQTQATQASIDAETTARIAQIQHTARDVLGKFDIQPEEIRIGVTAFDRRLHDASLVTQSPQYPANTVLGVQQCGFRKLSTGDVLRRPKVIVAGVGVA